MITLYLIDGSAIHFLPVLWPKGNEFHALASVLFPEDEVTFQSFNPEAN